MREEAQVSEDSLAVNNHVFWQIWSQKPEAPLFLFSL